MFERYTETARRVIFFARFEASQCGSPNIDTEHLLLALTREGRGRMDKLFGPDFDTATVRIELEKSIIRGKRIATSVEIPLSEDAKKVLNFSVEEAEALGSRHVGMEHMLLGLLRVERSHAAKILKARGVELERVRALVVELNSAVPVPAKPTVEHRAEALDVLDTFLSRIRSDDPRELALPLAANAHIVDVTGLVCVGQDEIAKGGKSIFGIYAGKSVTSKLVRVDDGPGQTIIATLLWFNLTADFEPKKPGHLMTVILGQEGEKWRVFFVQMTPIVIT